MSFAVWFALLGLLTPPAPQAYDRHSYPFDVKPYAELVKMFEYDASAPLDLRQALLLDRAGIRIFDVSFRVPIDEARTSAYLVVPPLPRRAPGVVWLNSGGGRDGFLPAAVLLARLGVVSLVVQMAEGVPDERSMRHDVVAIRRGLDLLAARSDVDAARIGFVGHSYGSLMGAVVAGVDHRFRCFVLDGGNLGMTYHLRFTRHPAMAGVRQTLPPEEFQKAMQAIAPFDAVHYIGHAAPAALLFQAARFDLGVSEQESLDLFAAASEPKQLRWYESGHEMGNDPAAVKDRVEFLAKHLSFPSPVPLLLDDMGLAGRR